MMVVRSTLALSLVGGCVFAPAEPLDTDATSEAGLGVTGPVEAVYQIEDGDTLAAIARRFAVPGGWRALAAANDLADPDRIVTGHGLVIPTDGLVAAGRDPFSLVDELDLIPRWTPVALTDAEAPPAPATEEPEREADDDHRDTCGGRHHHLATEPSTFYQLVIDDDGAREVVRPGCVEVGRSLLCVQPAEDAGAAADGAVDLVVDGRPWVTLPASFYEPLEIVEVDLDGDGRREVVVGDLCGVSNGAAIATYEMVVAAAPGAPPHRFTTSGWSLVATGDGCAIEHQTFEGIDDPVDGYGNYDVVRELVWRDGALATRGDGIRADRWSSQPPQRRAEPLLAAQVLARRTGTVIDFDDTPGGPRTIVLDIGGARVALDQRSWSWSDDEPDPDPEQQYAGLGWAGAPVLLPDDYRPPAAALVGRAATVESRLALPAGELSQVVWLSPSPR